MDDLYALVEQIPPFAVALAVLVPLAIAVAWLGSRRARAGGGGLQRPRRRYGDRSLSPLDPAFQAQVRRLEERQRVTAIADAPADLVLLRGVLAGADTTLGGAPGRECVWRNRADGRRDMAVAADTVFLRDPTGQAALDGLERAQVIAPPERAGRDRAWVGLYLGDEVEVIGRFVPEPAPVGADPHARVYGTLGADAKLHLRVVRRPAPEPAAEPASPADPPAPDPHAEET